MPQLTSIHVFGLLGQFDHIVNFHTESHVTILYGPNGVGKTKILTIIDAVLRLDLPRLAQIPFDDANLAFSDGSSLRVARVPQGGEPSWLGNERISSLWGMLELEFNLISKDGGEQVWSPRQELEEELGIDSLHEPAQDTLLRAEHHRDLRPGPVSERVMKRDYLMALRHRRATHLPPPRWLRDFCGGIPSHMIETQRLVIGHDSDDTQQKGHSKTAVQENRKDLATRIKDALAENSRTAARLDRTFPRRIMTSDPSDGTITDLAIREKFEAQSLKRVALSHVGLADNADELPLPDRELEPLERKVLWTYLADMEHKLQTFDALLARVERFMDIVNSKFLYKVMAIDQEEGFTFKTNEGRPVPVSGLSSGEQHELVLAYNLLFKAEPNSLVMIDEPEISLHVVWQQQFIADLKSISNVIPLQFVIATHSPQIINKWWDCAVALEPDTTLFG